MIARKQSAVWIVAWALGLLLSALLRAGDDTVSTAVFSRVSVRASGNSFDDSVAAMLKTASPYFGRESGKLVRGEELRGRVDFGELKFLGEARTRAAEDKK